MVVNHWKASLKKLQTCKPDSVTRIYGTVIIYLSRRLPARINLPTL